MKRTQIKVCRSCGRDNPKCDDVFRSEKGLRELFEAGLRGLFGRPCARLEIVDCLTNCDTPNSVRVVRGDRTFDFAWISTRDLAAQVVEFTRRLRRDKNAQPSALLQDHLLDKATGRGKSALKNHPLQPEKIKPIWI